MLRLLIIVLFTSFLTIPTAIGQADPVEAMYLEANGLYESGRYDEAVRMYNRILQVDADHTAAMIMRGKTKYELGAYKGTKMDAVLYLEKAGATKEIIQLMAATEFKMKNFPAAWGYVSTAVELDPYDAKMHYLAGEIAMAYGKKNDACEHYARGAILGSSKSQRAVDKACGGISKWIDPTPTSQIEDTTTQSSDTASNDDTQPEDKNQEDEATDPFDMIEDAKDGVEDEANDKVDEKIEDVEEETKIDPSTKPSDVEATDISLGGQKNNEESTELPPVNIDATQDIEIDESIIISIANGLGERKLNTKPNIFMLSDEDGIVVIDICVDNKGTVIEAEFNRETSTLFRSSLTSLALRKSKQFTFLPSKRDEQCGSLIYRIKA